MVAVVTQPLSAIYGAVMRALSILIGAFLVLSLTAIAHARDPFEGTLWKVAVTPDSDAASAGEKSFEDALTFKGGKFTSEKFKARGFDSVTYDTDTSPGNIGTFTATSKSDKNGSAKWSGQVAATSIKGDFVWTKPDGTVLTFSFTGEKKE